MTINESSIYRGLKRLRKMLYSCQFLMTKGERCVYGSNLLAESKESMSYFIVAFTFTEDKIKYMDKCIGVYGVLRADLDMALELNVIHFPKRKPKKDEIIDDTSYVNSRKVELCELLGKIDNEMIAFRNSLNKGKTICD